MRQGGICVRIEDCEPENLVTMQVDLCPVQRHKGVSCCYVSYTLPDTPLQEIRIIIVHILILSIIRLNAKNI